MAWTHLHVFAHLTDVSPLQEVQTLPGKLPCLVRGGSVPTQIPYFPGTSPLTPRSMCSEGFMQGKQDHLEVTCSIPCLLLQRGQVLCRRAGSSGTCACNKDISGSLQGKETSIPLAQLLQRTRLPETCCPGKASCLLREGLLPSK